MKKRLTACLCLTLFLSLETSIPSWAIVVDGPSSAPAGKSVASSVSELVPNTPPASWPVAESVQEKTSESPSEVYPETETTTETPDESQEETFTETETAVETVSEPAVETSTEPVSETAAETSSEPDLPYQLNDSIPEPEVSKPSLEDIQARLDAANCPDTIRDFVRNYPEAISYAEGFTEYTKNPPIIDISSDVREGEIPLFIQWDPRWGYRMYGNDYIGIDGCGPTCMSMVVCGLTQTTDWNPFALALWAYSQGYYQAGVGTSWALMTQGAPLLGLNAFPVDTTQEGVLSALTSGAPVVCSVAPGDFTNVGHFIILTGVDEAGLITVNDPNSPINSAKKWDLQTILSQTVSTWAFSVN